MDIRYRFYQFYLYLMSLWERYMAQLRKTVRFLDNSFQEETFYFTKESPFPAPSTEYCQHSKFYLYSRDARLLTSVTELQNRICPTEYLPHTLDILDAQLSFYCDEGDYHKEHDMTEFFQTTRYVDAPPLSVWIWAWALENRMPLFPSCWKCRITISTFDGLQHVFNVWANPNAENDEKLWKSVHTPFEMHRQPVTTGTPPIEELRIRTPHLPEVKEE